MKRITQVALCVSLGLTFSTAFASTEYLSNVYIDGPTTISRESTHARFELKNSDVNENDISWFINYTALGEFPAERVRAIFLKSSGKTATTGIPSFLPRKSRLQAVVDNNGKYDVITHTFCQDGSFFKCDGVKVTDYVNAGAKAEISFDILNGKEEQNKKFTYKWEMDNATTQLLKNTKVEINHDKLSFMAPSISKSQKAKFTTIITVPTDERRLDVEICIVGADKGNCGGVDNSSPAVSDITAYDYLLSADKMGQIEKGDVVSYRGIIYTCVNEARCNAIDPQEPVMADNAWIRSYF